MKVIRILGIIGLLTFFASCGTSTVEVEPIEGEVTTTFGPDFQAWLTYCEGKIKFQDIIEQYTPNEYSYEVDKCYYDLDLAGFTIPDIPENNAI